MWAFDMSAAVISPFTTIPVTTTPKQKMGKMYSNMSVFPGWVSGISQENNANADPQGKNAGYPEAHEQAVVSVHEEPQRNAGGEAGKRGEKKWSVDFIEHNV